MIVIDNFLNKSYADEIENHCIKNLQYSYDRNTSYEYVSKLDDNTYDTGQMSCLLFGNGTNHYFGNALLPIVWLAKDKIPTIKINHIGRIKANILLKQQFPKDHYNSPHQDQPESNYISMVYYVNESDGDTILFNEFTQDNKFTVYKRIQPKKNRLVVFESSRFHASSNPSINQDRFVLNFVLEGSI